MNRFYPNTEEDLQCDNCGQPVDSSGSSLDIPDENTDDKDICPVCGGPL